jgi:hypothetical protein
VTTVCGAHGHGRAPVHGAAILVDREAVIDKLVYTATNPVQDHLVDRVHHWPGVNGLAALLARRPLRASRPLHFFRPDGPMPDVLEMLLTLPAELGPTAAVLSELRDRVRAVELEREAERAEVHRERVGGELAGARDARVDGQSRDHPDVVLRVVGDRWVADARPRAVRRRVSSDAERPIGSTSGTRTATLAGIPRGSRGPWRQGLLVRRSVGVLSRGSFVRARLSDSHVWKPRSVNYPDLCMAELRSL